jgi:hypothetical protein
VTRQRAGELLAILQQHGGEARVASAVAGPAVAAPARTPRRGPALLAAGLAGVLVAGLAAWRLAPRPGSEAMSAVDLAARVKPSTVVVRSGDSAGTGFFVRRDLIATNAHVIADAGKVEVLFADGRTKRVKVQRRDPWLDLALLYGDGVEAPPLPLGDAAAVEQGLPVYFYGSPEGLDFTLSRALVSHPERAVRGLSLLQLDGNVNPGNSGGPLLDEQGRVLGIVTARVEGALGLGFALPVNYLYTGEDRRVDRPVLVKAAEWRRRLALAREADDRDAAAVLSDLRDHPEVVRAVHTGGRAVGVLVMGAHGNRPSPRQYLFFHLRDGSARSVCERTERLDRWYSLDGVPEGVLAERTRLWLERHGLADRLWAASAQVVFTCSDLRLAGLGVTVGPQKEPTLIE